METSVSKGCPQRKIAQMLERNQSLLKYYNNIAISQDWYSADRVPHTPLLDIRGIIEAESRSRQLSAMVVNIEIGGKLSDTLDTLEELSTSHKEWTMTGADAKQAMCKKQPSEYWLIVRWR